MKKYFKLLFLFFFLFILIKIILNSNEYIDCVQFSIIFWKNRIITTIFPFLLLSDFLINYGFIDIINFLFGNIFKFFFNVNGNVAYIFFMSMISGFPSSAIYINDLYQKNLISYESANKALILCHFSNPLFIIGFIGSIIGYKYAYYILIIHYLTAIIVGLLFRNLDNGKEIKIKFDCKSFGYILKNSIKKGIDSILLILGTIIFFNIVTKTLDYIDFPVFFQYIFNMFLELSNGINFVLNNFDYKYACLFISMILSFGGLCVHCQIISIMENSNIKYQNYLISRIIASLISGILVLLTFNLL